MCLSKHTHSRDAAKSLQSCLTLCDSVPHRQQPTRLPCPWDSPGKNTQVGCHFLLQCMKVKSEREVAQSCPTLSDPMDCSLPGSSIHGIFQARVLEWVDITPGMSPRLTFMTIILLFFVALTCVCISKHTFILSCPWRKRLWHWQETYECKLLTCRMHFYPLGVQIITIFLFS